MSFGKRRYDRLVAHDSVVDGKPYREYFARFLPLDLGEEGEQVDEVTLRRDVDDNSRRTPYPLPDGEEKLALAAFTAQAKGKTSSRARITAQADRGAQQSSLDPLQPHERITVERFRTLVTITQLPRRDFRDGITEPLISSSHDLLDTAKDALKLFDLYLPKPKGT